MLLSFVHHQLGRLIDAIVRTVPVDHDTIDSPADHVSDLPMNLARIGRTVADIHMVRTTEPQKQMRVDLAARARVEQRMHIDLAHIAGAGIPVGLITESIRCTGVVGRLCS